MPEIERERINLPDSQWWEIRTIITRGMRKRINGAVIACLDAKDLQMDGKALTEDSIKMAFLKSGKLELTLHAADDAMLLCGSWAWSFGETIDLEHIDALPEKYVTPVLERMRILYAPIDEKERQNFFEKR